MPTVQLDFSWTLEMSDWQNDRFARPCDNLSSSLSATWHHPDKIQTLGHFFQDKQILKEQPLKEEFCNIHRKTLVLESLFNKVAGLHLSRPEIPLLKVPLLKFVYLERSALASGFPLDDVMLHSGNCSDCQMAFRTDHFVDRTFQGSNWSPTEQLVKNF